MATKRKRSHRKSKRVGAATLNPGNPIVMLAAVGVGYYFSDKLFVPLRNMLPMKTTAATTTAPATIAPIVSGTVLGAGMTGVGALLMLKGKKTMVKTVAGGVLAGVGLKGILKDQGVVTGFQSVPAIGRRGVNGFQSVPAVGAVPNALQGGFTTSRMPAMGAVPNSLKGGFTTSRMPAMAGFDEGGYRD